MPIREDHILPHLAALAILLRGDDQALPDGTMQVTAPGEAAGLIDQLRTAGIIVTYEPDTRTIRTSDSAAVTIGRTADTRTDTRTTTQERRNRKAAKAPIAAGGRAWVTFPPARKRAVMEF